MRTEDPPQGYQEENTRRLFLHLPRTVVMIGMMGVGKTVIGQQLAAYLQVPFFDSDAAVEALFGCTVYDFFSRYGENAFRESERKIVANLLAGPVCVLASGGGAFMDPQTRAVIKAQAVSVWLKASLDLLIYRTTKRIENTRPLLLQGNPRTVLSRLLKERSPIYNTADIIIESQDDPCESIVERIATALTHHFDYSVEAF